MDHRSYHTDSAWNDMLFCMVAMFMMLLALALLQINPEAKDEQPKPKAEFFIVVTWPSEMSDDVDTYVEDPGGAIAYFQSLSPKGSLINLERDDTGNYNDTVTSPNGVIRYNINREITVVRGIVPGEYVVNVHMYGKRGPEAVPVVITLEKLNPRYEILLSRTVTLGDNGDERTAFRFTLNADGDVIDRNFDYKRLVPNGIGGNGYESYESGEDEDYERDE